MEASTPVYALKNKTATAKITFDSNRTLLTLCLTFLFFIFILSNIVPLKTAIAIIKKYRMCLIDKIIEYVFSNEKKLLDNVDSFESSNPVTRRTTIDT